MERMLQNSPGSAPQGSAMPTLERNLYILTAAVAAATWLAPWLLLGRKEAWDHSTYFTVAIPLMSVVAAYAAFRARSRWWRWPLTLVLAQFATALLLGGFGNLFPLGIIVFAIFAVPMLIAAAIAAWIARRRERAGVPK
jgi:hypothetical protein